MFDQLAEEGGTILFVGTKKQAQDSVKEEAERCGNSTSTNVGSAVR